MIRVLLVLAALLPAPAATAITIHVPADHATIQAAIDASSSADLILVAPGTYFENVNFKGKNIIVRSTGGTAVTTIDAGGLGAAVTFNSGETQVATLSGFTLTGGIGWRTSQGFFGGGVYCENSSPTIELNAIVNNVAGPSPYPGWGAGIYCKNAHPTIRVNTISANLAANGVARGGGIALQSSSPIIKANTIDHNTGGGIWCDTGSDPLIDQNVIESNVGPEGAGVYIAAGALPEITANSFEQNHSWTDGGAIAGASSATIRGNLIHANIADDYGGGVALKGGSPTLAENTITANQSADAHGGGVRAVGCTPFLVNNFIHSNIAVSMGPITGKGGGVSLLNAPATLVNNTVAYNISWSSGGGIAHFGGAPDVRNSIVYLNSSLTSSYHQMEPGATVSFSDVQGGHAGVGNIDLYPDFVNPASSNRDLHLLGTSPCFNVGNGADPMLPPVDVDGDPRIHYGAVDMGADEFAGCAMQFAAFGQGLAGSQGFVPALSGSGSSCGAGGYSIHVDDGLGAASGFLWVGLGSASTPFKGGTLYIDLAQGWSLNAIQLLGPAGVAGAGFLDLVGQDVSSAAGSTVHLQLVLSDPGAQNGASLSNALEVNIGE